jgi:hypothetical protein
MVRITEAAPESRGRVIPGGPGSRAYQLRAPIREAIATLEGEQMLEVEADLGETLRRLKVMTRRAAREVGKDVQYGETEQGTLLVWLAAPTRRRRRRRTGEQAQGTGSPTPQEELPP